MQNSQNIKRVLVIRNDRMGDLILTTPLFEALHICFPGVSVSVMVAPHNLEIVKENPHVDEILLDDYDRNYRGIRDMVNDLKNREFDAAILAIPSLRTAMAIFLAGIPKRIGPGTHLYCYLFLNRIRNQHRSRVEKHEAEYNLDLLVSMNIKAPPFARAFVKPGKADMEWVKKRLPLLGVKHESKKLVVIHPGMGKSALNWNGEYWAKLIKMLHNDKDIECLITGSNSDRAQIQEILACAGKICVPSLVGQTTVGWLTALLSKAHAFVGPSTGPMHLAATLGVHTFAIFSPVRVQSPERWGPWNAEKKSVFVPQVMCPARHYCIGRKCAYYYCLDRIYPEAVYKKIRESVCNYSGK